MKPTCKEWHDARVMAKAIRQAKPHLIMIFGLWHCGTATHGTVGVGYTPLQAYDEWLLRSLKA